MKIQYPGVADGIDSDINNLVSILNATGLVPDGLFLDDLVRVARKELAWEVDYIRERVRLFTFTYLFFFVHIQDPPFSFFLSLFLHHLIDPCHLGSFQSLSQTPCQ